MPGFTCPGAHGQAGQPAVSDFTWPVRVYYEDTDAGGIVYYANYLRFMERARTEWLRARGLEQDALARLHGVMFVVRRAELDFLRPGRFNDRLAVRTRVAATGRASLVFEQDVERGGAAPELLCRGEVRIACVDVVSLRPRPLPGPVLSEIVRE